MDCLEDVLHSPTSGLKHKSIFMPKILISALKDYKVKQKLNGNLYNINLVDKKSLVFANNDGKIRTYSGTKKIS